MAQRPKYRDHMYYRSTPRRSQNAANTQYGYRPREWADQPLGVILVAYREAYGKSVEDVAQDLCLRRAHIRAIEQEGYADLPLLSYSAGFVRSYATYLGLPGEEMVSRFRDGYRLHHRDQPTTAKADSLSSVGTVAYSPRWPSFAVLVIAALLLGSSYMVMAAYTAATNPTPLPDQILLPIEFVGTDANLNIVDQTDLNFEDIHIEFNIDPSPASAIVNTTNQELAEVISVGSTNEIVNITAGQDQVVVYGITTPQPRPDVSNVVAQPLEPSDRQHRVVISAVGRALLTLVDDATGQSFLRNEYQRGDQYLVPDGQIVRLMSQDIDRLELIIDGISYRVAPAIAALNEPLVLDPDTLPNTSQLIATSNIDL